MNLFPEKMLSLYFGYIISRNKHKCPEQIIESTLHDQFILLSTEHIFISDFRVYEKVVRVQCLLDLLSHVVISKSYLERSNH